MKIQILTLFPDLVSSFFKHSLIQKAQDSRVLEVMIHDLRQFASDKHKTADDEPYGGGPGMVIKGDLCLKALQDIISQSPIGGTSWRIILTTPDGKQFNQKYAEELARVDEIIILAGRYEGIDERVRKHVTDEISIGDYILMGGELPALVITESVARLIPGVVGDPESLADESFTNGRLDYPHYTRPAELNGDSVPEVLISGDHAAIARWRKKESLRKTLEGRPDLFTSHPPTAEEQVLITEILNDLAPRA